MFLGKVVAIRAGLSRSTIWRTARQRQRPRARSPRSSKSITGENWNFAVGDGLRLFARLQKMPIKLRDLAYRMGQGIRTSANEVYVLDLISSKGNLVTVHPSTLAAMSSLNGEYACHSCKDVKSNLTESLRLATSLVSVSDEARHAELIGEGELRDVSRRHLTISRQTENTQEQRRRTIPRRTLARLWPRAEHRSHAHAKILVPDIADRASFALDEKAPTHSRAATGSR